MKNINLSSKLFAEPSLIEGISRIVDLSGTLQEYNTSRSEKEADAEALKKDWMIVGDDLIFSINLYGQRSQKSI